MAHTFKRVVIIDDDSISNFLCEKIMERTAFAESVKSYTNASEALKILEKSHKDGELPNLVFLDINMPGLGGFEFLDELHEGNFAFLEKLKIVMLSTSLFEKDRTKALSYAPVVEYVTKPLSLEAIEKLKTSIK